jgi:hypothetical protein
MSYGYEVLVKALTKNSYWFLNFSDQPFNSYNCLKIIFFLIKSVPIKIELALHWIQMWSRQGQLIAGFLVSGRQLFWHPERSHSAETGI